MKLVRKWDRPQESRRFKSWSEEWHDGDTVIYKHITIEVGSSWKNVITTVLPKKPTQEN